MEWWAAFVQYADAVVYGLLTFLALRERRRQRGPALWAAVSFGLIGTLSIVGRVLPAEPGAVPDIAVRLMVIAIVVCPFAMFRFATSFEPSSPWIVRSVGAAVGVVVLATLVVPDLSQGERPDTGLFQVYALLFIAVWAAVYGIAAWRLWTGGRGLASMPRKRMRLLALGATSLAAALVPAVVPESRQPIGVEIVTLLLPTVSGVLFMVGLVPPPWLRSVWRRPEQAALQNLVLDVVKATTRAEILDLAVPQAARLVGASSATYVDGRIEVVASPYSPFFGDEEAALLRSFEAFVDLALQRVDLLDRERGLREDAEQARRDLETIVYGISHDLKNPIITILGYLGFIQSDHAHLLPAEAQHFLDRMERSGRYMEDLLNDLLELSRIGRTEEEVDDVDVEALVDELRVDLVQRFEGLGVRVPHHLPAVRMNPARARQLFTNLLENAAKHGGRSDLTVTVLPAALHGADEGFVSIDVSDDGVGIPEDQREAVFGIFQRLGERGAGTGTGVGLALCERIAQLAGGDITIVEPPAGAGATFRVTLPTA